MKKILLIFIVVGYLVVPSVVYFLSGGGYNFWVSSLPVWLPLAGLLYFATTFHVARLIFEEVKNERRHLGRKSESYDYDNEKYIRSNRSGDGPRRRKSDQRNDKHSGALHLVTKDGVPVPPWLNERHRRLFGNDR
jgi:hypothetical protein